MKNRGFTLMLAIIMLITCIFSGNVKRANASVIIYGDYEFDESTKTITKYNGSASNVVIPEMINNIAVEKIGDSAFDGCTGIQDLVIPSNVKKIGNFSFRECSSISKLTIEEGVQDIGRYAFFGCVGLKEITIPGSVSSIGEYAFSKCYGVKEVEIYNGVKTIGANAFSSCMNLLEATIPSSVESIGDSAFQECHFFKTLNMGEGIKNIGNYAFNECDIDDINIPNSVESIGEYAFLNSGAQNIWINKNTVVTSEAFGYWDEPNTIYITGNPAESEIESVKEKFKSYETFDSIKFVGILCKEDIDNDKVVEIDDLANLASKYNVVKGDSNYKSEIDINGDGIIDIYDLVRVANKM